MKATLLTLAALCALILSGCTTPVAIDPMTGEDQVAEYRAGYFYAPLDASIGHVFKTAIRELDNMGYFRTGELHRKTEITIYARKVGDQPVSLRATQMEDGRSQVRIRVGRLGNLAESQNIFARVRDAL
ncbi:MAG: DUF3568 family protein [Puniceicoccaceae bacterium]|nr:MAG: DUF3568 family protein [Puniceicoccaceae bacterium]